MREGRERGRGKNIYIYYCRNTRVYSKSKYFTGDMSCLVVVVFILYISVAFN